MPINHFKNRDEDGKYPDRLTVGDTVKIIEKEHQGSRNEKDLVEGIITRKLSKGGRYENGAKVMIQLSENDWRYEEMGNAMFIGRVQYIVSKIDDETNPYLKYLDEDDEI